MQSIEVIKRVDRVSIERCRNSIRIRFTLDKKSYSLTIGKDSKETVKKAVAVANQINADILWNCFDTTLVKYGKAPTKINSNLIQLPNDNDTEITIKEIWDTYLMVRGNSLPNSSKGHHKGVGKWISLIPSHQLGVSHAQTQIEVLKLTYGKNTVSRLFRSINAACNLAVKLKLLDSNPYAVYRDTLVISTQGERSCKPFEPYEIPIILNAFKTDRFCNPNSAFKHSYYYPFVLCLTLTGARPEDVIALTIDDIIYGKNRKVLRFNKAYTHGELKGTKTETIRMFPINEQLEQCLKIAPIYNNKEHSLLFPSQKGNYLDLHNFTNRYFTPIVKELVKVGEIENQLPTYHLRHTFITQMIRKGIDIATIGNLVGNSAETILSNYLGTDKGVELPDIDV
ncbi:MAG: hypothetical protein EA365_15880 [Gloeocapsa sp. DLM2.Bin57]|nr:MAG: hypothetical protein EA365_15880 [Gloeocapsa sp. DLM2.Bin57]